MLVPPPGLFSTMTCWPRRSLSQAAISRAIRSVVPPAAKGTRKRNGRDGQACAPAGRGREELAATSMARRRRARRGRGMVVPTFWSALIPRDTREASASRRTRAVTSVAASWFETRGFAALLTMRPSESSLRRLACALRQAVTEMRQDLLRDRGHVGARHAARQPTALGPG